MLRRAVATCGNADFGRLGLGRELTVVEIPKIITSLIDLHPVAVSAGGAHTATATRDGTVMTWGLNDHGQLGHATDEPAMFEPREVPLPEPAIALAAGHRHTLCLSDSGNIWAWGSNAHGQLGIGGDLERCAEPRLVAALKGSQIVGIAAGADHSLAVTSSGEVYSWGCGDSGRLGHGTPPALKLWGKSRDETKPRLVRALETQRVTQVAAGYMHSACITSEGQAFVFGSGRFYQLGRASDRDADAPIQV